MLGKCCGISILFRTAAVRADICIQERLVDIAGMDGQGAFSVA
jgi:hypothetical protein